MHQSDGGTPKCRSKLLFHIAEHYAQLQTNDSHIEMTFSIDERNRLNFQQPENIFFEWTSNAKLFWS